MNRVGLLTRPVVVVVLTAALVSCTPSRSSTSAPVKAGQTVVSLEFDDGTASQWEARRLLADHRLRATFFVVSGAVGTPGYLDWRQVSALQNDGHEIAGHTVTHPHLAALPPDEARREICTGRQALLERGFPVTNLAYPYGSYTGATEQMAAACGYNSARTMTGPGPERVRPADLYATAGAVAVTQTTTPAELQAAVTGAESRGGGWVQILFHRLCDGCDPLGATPATLGAFLDWLALRQGSKTVVRTVADVVGGPVRPVVAAPPPSPAVGASNGLVNSSLESDTDGDQVPDCWTETGYGDSAATWAPVADAHSGTTALHLEVSSLARGDRKLMVTQDLGACSPTVVPGRAYRMSAWYRSGAQPILVAFYRDARGAWTYWSESPALPAAADWTQATWTTPPAPDGATGLSVGVLLNTTGALSVDDLSLVAST